MTELERFTRDVGDLYQRHIVAAGKEAQLLILASFLVTFTIVRLITHAIRAGRFRHLFRNVQTSGGLHLHHLVIGILLLLAVGYISTGIDPDGYERPLAILFGIGAALTLDEFALWLRLKDVYWTEQGRASIDAVIIMATIIALGVLGLPFWAAIGALLFV
ncbi:MAG TPA: hypothetical protein VD789_07010 [Thermomicrobiales bacterium]|nr:hypothetical protein [Thermomicrobiales bacterium]